MKNYLNIFLLFISAQCLSQNLVPNPGFEIVPCDVSSQFAAQASISNWFSYDPSQSSPDIFNTCFTISGYQSPNNVFGYAYPHQDEGMSGMGLHPSGNIREEISIRLLQPLKKDSAYCVSFWVKNAYSQDVDYYTDNFGGLFSEDTIHYNMIRNTNAHVKVSPQTQYEEWTEVTGYYIAQGSESFFNVGFFGPYLAYSHPLAPPDDLLYYYLDDVSVTPCNKDSLLAVICEFPNVFSPDGNAVNDLYTLQLRNIKKLNIQIFNRWGNVVREYDGVTDTWDGTDQQGQALSEGVYFIKALAETNFGELLPKYQYVHLVR